MSHLLQLPDKPAPSHAPLGAWLKIPAIEPAQMMAFAGFDFSVIDLEHTLNDGQTTSHIISICAAIGLTPLVRVPDHLPSTIQRVLDGGAAGVVVPRVDDAADAEAIVDAVRFPPRGTRGAGGTSRAGRWGRLPQADYLAYGNERALCILQLESANAIGAVDAIMRVPGVDAVMIGVVDLALSLGVPASDEQVTLLVSRGIAAAAVAGKPCGLAFGSDPVAASAAASAGAGFVILSNDASMLASSANDLARAFRSVVPIR